MSAFTCEMCERTFQGGVTEEEARKEHLDTFGFPVIEDGAVTVCSACYAKFMRWFNQQQARN